LHNVKNYNLLSIILGIFVGINFSSCSKKDLEATIPSYIAIDDISLTTTYVSEGTNSEKITDAWVFINDDLIGVYELPAKIPILKEGSYDLKIYAGIKENGISGTRSRYLFYTPHEEKITLIKDKVLTISPQVTYTSSTNFVWLEDFENASLSFTYDANSHTMIDKVTTEVFEGVNSGKVFLSSTMDFFEMHSPSFTSLPTNGDLIYLELNFKTNEPILMGIYADTDQLAHVYLNTSTSWNKIYINLTDIIGSKPYASSYKLFFGMQDSPSNPFGVSNPEFYIDNIKLIHL
jgi:hypothetical protein